VVAGGCPSEFLDEILVPPIGPIAAGLLKPDRLGSCIRGAAVEPASGGFLAAEHEGDVETCVRGQFGESGEQLLQEISDAGKMPSPSGGYQWECYESPCLGRRRIFFGNGLKQVCQERNDVCVMGANHPHRGGVADISSCLCV